MGNYFKPLRRKVGVVTLVLACVFAAVWMRSQNTVDGVGIRLYGKMHDACSAAGGIYWLYQVGIDDVRIRVYSHDVNLDPEGLFGYLSARWITKEELCGFVFFFEYWEERDELIALKVPYWSTVVPLTLLSSWLIFSKPRTSNSQPASVGVGSGVRPACRSSA